ncbi:helix-turn-helix domain-containing protein [Psychrilyobacter sp.]|uniref:helix-turn-helix domain-containing protein n=1 Tax=Psychrilyobacter sp. TaxID=2586924 RepID=UPI00301A7664
MEKRKSYPSKFKFKVVLEALSEQKTLQQIAKEYEISPSQITRWSEEIRSKGFEIFDKTDDDTKKIALSEKEQKRFYEITGEKTMEVDWFKKN